MTWTRTATVTVLLMTLAAPSVSQPQPRDVQQALERFLIPFSNRDVPAFVAFFAEDATMFFPPSSGASAKRVEGRAAIAETFKAAFGRVTTAATPGGLIQPQDLHVQMFDGFAIATFHLGDDATRGRRTFVLRRVDSDWKIVHLHASTFPVK